MISEPGGWRQVDQAADPTGYIEYLRTVSALETVQFYKRRSFHLMALGPGGHVLDVGCGRGDEVIALAQIVGDRGLSAGVDASATMIAQAKRRAQEAGVHVELKVGDALALPFPDASFDATRIERTLQHLADPGRAIGELRRVTRPGGRVVGMEPDWATLTVDAPDSDATAIFLRVHLDRVTNGIIGRQLWRRFRDAGLEDLMCDTGVVVLTDFASADPVLGLTEATREAVGDRAISAERAAAWLDSVRDADAHKRFFASLTGFLVSGRVPVA